MDTVVYNASQLAAAVSGSTYDYIYLGAHIQISILGMTINPNRTELIIDGYHEGNFYSLEDANVVTTTGTIGIRAASNITVTFKNMLMVGRNYFGMPYVSELVDTSGVTVVYENVIYEGPQITFNPLGLTRYKDCDITIAYPSRAQEVGEVNRVEFQGSNVITHTGTGDAVFWFRGNAATAYCKVLEDAYVSVTTVNYFMYSYQCPVVYVLEPNARFTLTSRYGISLNGNHRAASFLADTGASFRYIQEEDNDDEASLYLNGDFVVNEGASVYMQADFEGAKPLISFMQGNHGMYINNPRSVVLYNRADAAIAVGESDITRTFQITCGQYNQWYDATPFPGAGGITDPSDAQWHKPNWSGFTMTGHITEQSTQVDSTTFTPEELADLPELSDVSFQNAKVISMGSLPIHLDLVADDGRPVSGTTGPDAVISISYTVGGIVYTLPYIAGADGSFLVFFQPQAPAGTLVTIKANVPFLITTVAVTVAAVADEITLQRTPDNIAFRLPPVSTQPDVLLGRINPLDAVEVLDLRNPGTDWRLLASVLGPLRTESGEVSGNAVVFKDLDGTVTELSETPIPVYEGQPYQGQTNIYWQPGYGMLIRVTEPIRSNTAYTTELKWELEIVP